MKKSIGYWWGVVSLLGVVLTLPCCVSTETLVPPVDPAHANASLLTEGRRVYLRRCTACHSPEPVNGYTAAEWKLEVADMRDDAKLTPEEEEKLLAYLRAYSLKDG